MSRMSRDLSTQSPNQPSRVPAPDSRRVHPLLWALAGGILMGAIAVASLFAYSHFTTPPTTSVSGSGAAGTGHLVHTCTKGPAEVSAVVRQQIAQGLHLTPDELSTKLASGETILEVAAQQQVSADQLFTIEVNAYIAAHQQLVNEGKISQQDADRYNAEYPDADPDSLNAQVQADCLRPAGDTSTLWCASATPSR